MPEVSTSSQSLPHKNTNDNFRKLRLSFKALMQWVEMLPLTQSNPPLRSHGGSGPLFSQELWTIPSVVCEEAQQRHACGIRREKHNRTITAKVHPPVSLHRGEGQRRRLGDRAPYRQVVWESDATDSVDFVPKWEGDKSTWSPVARERNIPQIQNIKP